MKLGACLVASDLNPLYLDFFPLVHRAWREIVGVRAVLALIADRLPAELEAFAPDVVVVPPIAGVDTAFHAQCIRLIAPQVIGAARDEAVIISDIDMIPMRRDYYIDPLARASAHAFVVYRSNAFPVSCGQIAMCYNAATPAVWGQLFGRAGNLAEANEMIGRWHRQIGATADGDSSWSTDQISLARAVAAFDQARVLHLTDGELGFARLDRGAIGTRLSAAQRSLARRHFFADYHMKRPQRQYARLNEYIAGLAIAGARKPWPVDPILYRASRRLMHAAAAIGIAPWG